MADVQPTRALAGFFADLRYESLPVPVRERVTDIVLDTVASALAGRHGEETAQIEALADAIGGPKTSTVIAGAKQSLAGATLVNGYQVTDWTDDRKPDPNPRRGLRTEPGTISLQAHDPTTNIRFRNLRIAELPEATHIGN